MKKILLAFAAIAIIAPAAHSYAGTPAPIKTVTVGDWKKSTDGTWKGNNNTWYKLEAKTGNVLVSTDGRLWAVSNGTWQDKDGKTYKIMDKQLQVSVANNSTWGVVAEWKWQGPDGTWYKFDKDWALWTMVVKSNDTKGGN